MRQDIESPGFIQANWVKFKDFSRLSYSFQVLKVNEKFLFKCLNSTSKMLDSENGEISTRKEV